MALSAPEKIARLLDDLVRRVTALERTGQIARSTVAIDEGDVTVAEGISKGVRAESTAVEAAEKAEEAAGKADTAAAAAADAITAATDAAARADGAVVSFFGAEEPEDAKEGDLWRKPDGDVLQYVGGEWVAVSDPELRSDLEDALGRLEATEGALDGKISTFYAPLTDAPTAAAVGDLWIVEGTNWLRRWDGAEWVDARDVAIEEALTEAGEAKDAAASASTAASEAQGAADEAMSQAATAAAAAASAADTAAAAVGIAEGKGEVYIQSTPPPESAQGDTTLWIDTTNGANTPKRWSGSAWVAVTDKAAVDAADQAAQAHQAAQAAQATASEASDLAEQAHALAGTADSNAQSALTSASAAQATADARPKILFSTDAPSGTAPQGSTWFRVNSAGTVIGQWQQTAASNTGSTWTRRDIASEVIANLDVGKLVAGTAVIDDAVAQKLISEVVEAQVITGPTIRTAASGRRVEFTTSGIRAYNAANRRTLDVGSGDKNFIAGTLSTAPEGEPGVIVGVSGDTGLPFIRFSEDGTTSGDHPTIWVSNDWQLNLRGKYNRTSGRGPVGITGGLKIDSGGVGSGNQSWMIYQDGGAYFEGAVDTPRIGQSYAPIFFENIGGGRIRQPTVRSTTTTANANVYVGSTGVLALSTSTRRNKIDIEDMPEEWAERLLDVEPRTWFDRGTSEALADALGREANGEEVPPEEWESIEPLRRIPGLIAEDVEAAGLEAFVNYDADGEVIGLAYDRLWTLLIPLMRELRRRTEEQEAKVDEQEERLARLEALLDDPS